MKRLLLDTNIYGLLAVDLEFHLLHQIFLEHKSSLKIYGFNIIRKELKKVPKKIIENVNIQASLLRAYDYFVSKEYAFEKKFSDVADLYYNTYVLFGGKLSQEEIYNDLLIVACASTKEIDIVVSEDNTTMINELFKMVYTEVNNKQQLRLPTFIKYKTFKELLMRTSFSNPFINCSDKLWIILNSFNIFKGVFSLLLSFHLVSKESIIYKIFVDNE